MLSLLVSKLKIGEGRIQLTFKHPSNIYHYLFQDKRLKITLNGNRKLIGTLRGYDAFLNVVLEEVDQDQGGYLGQVVVRGNSIIQFEALERV